MQEGEKVRIADREANAEDLKTGLFYSHLRGLAGTIQKLYETSQASVEIDIDSLPAAIQERHLGVQEQMRSKWLDGLSDEARNNLTPAEREFRLRYTVLVQVKDLMPLEQAAKTDSASASTASRTTSADLTDAEERELARRRSGETSA